MKFLNFLLLISFVVTLNSCKQDPYPNIGNGEFVDVPRQEPKPPPTPQQPLPALAISLEDNYEFREGRYREIKIRVEVEEPGVPIVKVKGLPDGAEFDEEKMVIRWTPGFFMGNNPSDPSIKSRIYPVTVWLGSTVLPKEQVRKTISLVVFDSPRNINVQTDRNNVIKEGAEYSKIITLNNPDYPQGPFKFLTKDLPANLEVEEVDPNTYRLKFKPDFFHVNLTKQTNGRLEYKGKIIVANPANHIVEQDYSISVRDERQGVKLVAPAQIEQGLDASFQVAAYDLNREVAPVIRLTSDNPIFGDFKETIVKNPTSFSSVLNIFWKDIPPKYNGTKQKIRFETCVLSSSNTMTNCETGETEIKLVVRDRNPPVINREEWKAGELIYLGFNEVLRRRVVVTDSEDPKLTPDVKIFPVEMRKWVKWNAARDSLTIQIDKAGVHQFNMVAKSAYNMEASESFIVEVFPKNRKKTLLFADSTRDPEVLFYKDTFKDTMDVMNPAIQEVNLRNVEDRDTLVITTSTLLDPSVKSELYEAISNIENVVIASPLYKNLPEKFLIEMEENYDLKPIGRYSELPNLPPLAEMKIETTSQFVKAKKDIFLKGNTTLASSDPIVFNAGLDDPAKVCKGVVGLAKNSINPLVIGLSCNKIGGGKIVILGVEWADFLTAEEDKTIPVKWFETLIKKNF